MRKNKMAALGLAFAMAITAAGCASSSESNKDNTTEAEKASSVEAETTVHDTTEEVTETAAPETTKSAETTVAETEKETETESEPADKGFEFDQNTFPVIDGSTSTKPMAVAVRSLLLGESRDDADKEMEFHKTSASFNYLINEETDLLIVAQPSDEVFDMMKEAEFEYDMEAFALEGLVFVCNKNNPVDSLTSQQIIDIYTGKITNWKEVGGSDEEIIPVQRNHSSGSQVMMDHLVMQGNEMMEVPTKLMPSGMGELIEVVESYDNSSNALGYTPYYYATSMGMADKLKILKVNDVMPSSETIKSREYPYVNPYYVVIEKDREANDEARILYDWILSKEGQKLTEMEGYVPAVTDPKDSLFEVNWDNYEKAAEEYEEVYTRLSEGALPDFVPSDDYEAVFPYLGVRAKMPRIEEYEDPSQEYEWIDGDTYKEKYGFCSINGVILTDPCFNDCYSYDSHTYIVSMGEGDNIKYGLISKSGDKYTGCIYSEVQYLRTEEYYAIKGSGADITFTTYSEDVEIIDEDIPLKIEDDSIYDDDESDIIFIPDNRVLYSEKLYDAITGEKLCDLSILYPYFPVEGKAYAACCGSNEYCLIDLDGKEITDHYTKIIQYEGELFIASKDGMDHYDVINGSGEIIDTIEISENCVIERENDYYLIVNKSGLFDLYDRKMQIIVEGLESNGELVYTFDISKDSMQDCPFVKGKKDGVLIDPLTGKSLELDLDYVYDDVQDAYRADDSIYFRTRTKLIHVSKDMEVLDEINEGWASVIDDVGSKKTYFKSVDDINETITIRDVDTLELIATLPHRAPYPGPGIYNGICIESILDKATDAYYTRLFPLNDPDNTIFLYKAFDSIGDIE